MSLPTTNLTFHMDASVVTDLWQNTAPFATHPADGGAINFWDDVEHGANTWSVIAVSPVWRQSTPLMLLPCADFNGTSQSMKLTTDDALTDKALSDLIANNAFTVLVALYAEGITTNAAAAYDNDAILDGNGFFGIHLKNAADPHVLFYNWDGNEDTIPLAITLNASHVLFFQHNGGNIIGSIDGGSETSLASGNTSDLTGRPNLGVNYAGTAFYNGRIGEMAIYNAALAGSNKTDAISYFTTKWLTGAAVTTKNLAALGVG